MVKQGNRDVLAVGVDVGGTKISAGLVDEAGHVNRTLQIPTSSASVVEETIIRLVGELLVTAGSVPVGVSVAGFVDREGMGLTFAPNIPGWTNPKLRDSLSVQLGCPVTIENDANAATWGEAAFGAGTDAADLVCLTIGTGLGGGLIVGGELQRGAWGFAAEYGHMVLIPDGRRCACGQFGCWEQYVSGRALVREAAQLASKDLRSSSKLLRSRDSTSDPLTGPEVTQAAQIGDVAALGAFRIVGTYLGQGLARLVAIVDPARFVIGGGVSQAKELLLEPARSAFKSALPGQRYRPLPAIEFAQLGVSAGIIGVADLARRAAHTSDVR